MPQQSVTRRMRSLGFSRAATLEWPPSGPDDFEFQFVDQTAQAKTKGIIYVFLDIAAERVLYVGHTGGHFDTRSGGYRRWLNGLDKRSGSPINQDWVNCLFGECTTGKVEIWVKQSFPEDAGKREIEESRLIHELRPVLNKRP